MQFAAESKICRNGGKQKRPAYHVLCDMYPQYWTPSMGVFLCDTVMSTKRSVLNCTDILQKIHAGRVAAAYRMCYDEVQNFKRSDEF